MKLDSQLARKLWELNGIDMRKAGIIIFVVGFIITIIASFNYVTNESIVEIGDMETTSDRVHSTDWSPLAGVAVMVAGGLVYLVGGKKR